MSACVATLPTAVGAGSGAACSTSCASDLFLGESSPPCRSGLCRRLRCCRSPLPPADSEAEVSGCCGVGRVGGGSSATSTPPPHAPFEVYGCRGRSAFRQRLRREASPASQRPRASSIIQPFANGSVERHLQDLLPLKGHLSRALYSRLHLCRRFF